MSRRAAISACRSGNGERLTFDEPPNPVVLDQRTAIDQQPHELAGVQGIAAGTAKDRLFDPRGERRAAE